MKIKIVNYMEGEARFVIEGIPEKTFCIPLTGHNTKEGVIDELKSRLPKADITKEKYDNLKLKELEGTDI